MDCHSRRVDNPPLWESIETVRFEVPMPQKSNGQVLAAMSSCFFRGQDRLQLPGVLSEPTGNQENHVEVFRYGRRPYPVRMGEDCVEGLQAIT